MFRHSRIFGFAIAALYGAAFPSLSHAQWNCSSPPCTTNTMGDIWYSNGNVGIGTSSPARKLDVIDGSSVFQMRFSDGTDEGGIGADGNGFFRIVGTIGGAFGTGSAAQGTFSEIMRVWSGGVGIGTSAPEATLHATTGTAPFELPADRTFAGIIANLNNAAGQSGLLVENAWSANTGYAFQVASDWNGTSNAFTPYFTVTGAGTRPGYHRGRYECDLPDRKHH